MNGITHFFGYSKGTEGLGCQLVFGLKDGMYAPMLVEKMDIAMPSWDGRLEWSIKLKTYTYLSPSELLEAWIKGQWVQFDNDFRGMSYGSILAHGLVSMPNSGLPSEGIFVMDIEFPIPAAQTLTTACGKVHVMQGQTMASQTVTVYMPGGHMV